jgi:hypothetical protein
VGPGEHGTNAIQFTIVREMNLEVKEFSTRATNQSASFSLPAWIDWLSEFRLFRRQLSSNFVPIYD